MKKTLGIRASSLLGPYINGYDLSWCNLLDNQSLIFLFIICGSALGE